ncbi:hypothetical protein NDU88_005277 [Pleurodeles waltl]|uniref:Uncharacterized protein n=1 Tax=Pleurodeles waltl TaxID=8319 RepID=A0AAV7MIY1_PLEWA|nr:hypothetical protein NDU88_005277 [Pleurodeles waltl]
MWLYSTSSCGAVVLICPQPNFYGLQPSLHYGAETGPQGGGACRATRWPHCSEAPPATPRSGQNPAGHTRCRGFPKVAFAAQATGGKIEAVGCLKRGPDRLLGPAEVPRAWGEAGQKRPGRAAAVLGCTRARTAGEIRRRLGVCLTVPGICDEVRPGISPSRTAKQRRTPR